MNPDHHYRILIIGGPGSGKTNALLNLIKQEEDDDYNVIDKIYLHVKDPNKSKYQYLIKNRENNGLEPLKDPKILTEYSKNMQDVYKTINEYNLARKCNVLIVFDDMITDMISN